MKEYEIINTGKAVLLETLLKSDDISDQSIIEVFSAEGKFLAKGTRYQSWIADWYDSTGIAHKSGTGLTVCFKITEAARTNYTINLDQEEFFALQRILAWAVTHPSISGIQISGNKTKTVETYDRIIKRIESNLS